MRAQHNRVATVLAYSLATCVVSFWPTSSSADTAMEKAGRGLAAMTTPFLELPGNIVDTSEREGPLAGWTMGLAKGLGMTAVRPLVGVYELLTAPIPAPADFKPILRPEYPWSYFGVGHDSKLAKSTTHSKLAKK